MNKILFNLCITATFLTTWQPDFITAVEIARQKHELILINFSGSDWCGPCIRMHNEIFESEVFSKMADTSLVLINADFPRNKKNQLSRQLVAQNDMLADKYNANGSFPLTVLINASGKVIKKWEGLPKEGALNFTAEIKEICNANK